MSVLIEGTRIRVNPERIREGGYFCGGCLGVKQMDGFSIHVSTSGSQYLGAKCKACEGKKRKEQNRERTMERWKEKEIKKQITEVYLRAVDGSYFAMTSITRERLEQICWNLL